MLKKFGRSILKSATAKEIPKKGMIAAGIAGAGVHGFAKGLGSQDFSGDVYEFATGDRNIDQYVFGTDVGIRELMAPLPGEHLNLKRKALFNTRTLPRHFSAQRAGYYNNTMPDVSGSIVFGAYNSRMR